MRTTRLPPGCFGMNSEELPLLSLSLPAAESLTPLPWPSALSSQSLLPLMAERSSSAVRSGLPSALRERDYYYRETPKVIGPGLGAT